jgi:hypothetical protein
MGAPRKLTPSRNDDSRFRHVAEPLFTHTDTKGGSSEAEVKELAAMPVG